MPSSHHKIPTRVTGAEGSSSQISPSKASRCRPFSAMKVCWLHFRQPVGVHQLDTSCPSSLACPPRHAHTLSLSSYHDGRLGSQHLKRTPGKQCTLRILHVFVVLVTKVYTNVRPQSSWLIQILRQWHPPVWKSSRGHELPWPTSIVRSRTGIYTATAYYDDDIQYLQSWLLTSFEHPKVGSNRNQLSWLGPACSPFPPHWSSAQNRGVVGMASISAGAWTGEAA